MENEDTIKTIASLAERFPNPEEFISELERLSIPEDKEGDFFLHIGIILYNHSNFKLALPVWERALTYFINLNRIRCATYTLSNVCLSSLLMQYWS